MNNMKDKSDTMTLDGEAQVLKVSFQTVILPISTTIVDTPQ